MSNADGPLPHVDEHRVQIAAPALVVWDVLGASLREQGRRGAAYAKVVGTEPARAVGDPLHAGSTIPGFAVREAVPPERLVLAGRHRFSRYELVFTLEAQDGDTLLSARTSAAFPGLHGAAYRALVIGSGAHRLLVRRWVRGIKWRAEDAPG